MEITHEPERKILLKLIHALSLGFNKLWSKDGESNTFAYQLGKLESNGLVAKNKDGLYQFTEERRKLSAFIEGDTGKRAEFSNFSHVLLVQNGDKWLTQKRLKEPFFGY